MTKVLTRNLSSWLITVRHILQLCMICGNMGICFHGNQVMKYLLGHALITISKIQKNTPAIREVISHSNQHLTGVNFSYEKPVKLKWQHSLYTDVYGGFNSSTHQNKETGNDTRNVNCHPTPCLAPACIIIFLPTCVYHHGLMFN